MSGANLEWAGLHGALLDEGTQISDKWRRVWQIVTVGEIGRDLSDIDLSRANLSGANLVAANLNRSQGSRSGAVAGASVGS